MLYNVIQRGVSNINTNMITLIKASKLRGELRRITVLAAHYYSWIIKYQRKGFTLSSQGISKAEVRLFGHFFSKV